MVKGVNFAFYYFFNASFIIPLQYFLYRAKEILINLIF